MTTTDTLADRLAAAADLFDIEDAHESGPRGGSQNLYYDADGNDVEADVTQIGGRPYTCTDLTAVWRVEFNVWYDHDDPLERIADDEFFGKFSAIVDNRWSDHPPERPTDFDGRARKLTIPQHRDQYEVWWQPPADVVHIDGMKNTIVRILEHGYIGIGCTVHQRCECCDQWKRVGAAGLWGVEAYDFGNDHHSETASDALAEALAEAGLR